MSIAAAEKSDDIMWLPAWLRARVNYYGGQALLISLWCIWRRNMELKSGTYTTHY